MRMTDMSGERRERSVPFQPVFKLLDDAQKRVKGYKHKIVILSGKGGVGKSFITSQLALVLAMRGRKVAVLDADIYGSSIPSMLGIQGSRHFADDNGNILPVEGPLGIKAVAINLMLDSPDLPVVWRGPLASRAITELLSKVMWGDGDYMLVDMPPGTGDIAITVAQTLKDIDGAVIVTAPNMLTEVIVSKAINFVARNNVRILGLVENMSYFKCPVCGTVHQVLGKQTSELLLGKYGVKVLGRIPLDPSINEAVDRGAPYLLEYPDSEAAKAIIQIADDIIKMVEVGRDVPAQ